MKESIGVGEPQIAVGPYGDISEAPPPYDPSPLPDIYREFLATDARTVMIVLHPNHYNFFPNPSFRVDDQGWEIAGFGFAPIDPVAWCGQSLLLTGTGTVRYRDVDSDNAPAFVYVGPSQDITQLDWYEPGRASAEWTFSAYLLGGKSLVEPDWLNVMPARARLSMRAYQADEDGKFKSKPKYMGIPSVTDPASAPFGAEAVTDENGQVWLIVDGPYYSLLGKPPVSAVDPLSILSEGPILPDGLHPHLMYNGLLYGILDPYPEVAGVPLYEALADPRETAEPELETPSDEYLIVADSGDSNADGQVWHLIDQQYYTATGQQAWFAQVDGPWIELRDDGQWQRLKIRTDAYSLEQDGQVSFLNAWWIDAVVEVENADGVRLSSLMLDPSENPVAQYFDGGMNPEPNLDDFLWSKVDTLTQQPLENQCISYYYYDLRSRVKWLWDNLRFLVPIGRPYQIFFGSYDRPYIATAPGGGAAMVNEVTL